MGRKAHKLDFRRKLKAAAMGAAAVVGAIAISFVNPAACRAQSPPGPDPSPIFKAVSIQPTRPPASDMVGEWLKQDHGTSIFTATNAPLVELVKFAYDLDDSQISGGPDWITSQGYDVTAKIDSVNEAQIRRAFQKVLADRFKLASHRETKELPVYELVVGKYGPRLREVPPDKVVPGNSRMIINEPGHLVAKQINLAALVRVLSYSTGKLVVDKTGLKGFYDFALDWKENPEIAGQPGIAGTGQGDSPTPDEIAALVAAVPEQLGLEMKTQTDPIETLIIDHAEEFAGDAPVGTAHSN
ncbi:MAG TPA: TIGR03435 family protein [Candidatus Polarisedimenticolia bacterium]|nr:TIGR03435 family protein [Candidatus Polarisedimenticolia bacterium]